MLMLICSSKLIQEIYQFFIWLQVPSDSKASKIETPVKYIVHTTIDGCKCFTKLNIVPIQEWMTATTSVKERNTMLRKHVIGATVPGIKH